MSVLLEVVVMFENFLFQYILCIFYIGFRRAYVRMAEKPADRVNGHALGIKFYGPVMPGYMGVELWDACCLACAVDHRMD